MNKALLVILDGFGEAPANHGNAVAAANMPFLHSLRKTVPLCFLKTDGNASGLPEGQTGASEPGHVVMGAGRIVWQPLEEINQSFQEIEFPNSKFETRKNQDKFKTQNVKRKIEENLLFQKFLKKAKSAKKVHLIGMLSDGGVHSHIEHVKKLDEILSRHGIKNAYLHCFGDGRDVPERSIKKYVAEIFPNYFSEDKNLHSRSLQSLKLASLVGRYYGMDRDTNWERTRKAYELLTEGKGEKIIPSDLNEKIYKNADTDYYLPAFTFPDFEKIENDDVVLFFNFRSDRAEQLTSLFTNPEVKEEQPIFFPQKKEQFFIFGPYGLKNAQNIFPPEPVQNNLGKWLSDHGKTQLRIAETEKYAHVTFFFNSQDKEAYTGEDRIMVESPKVSSYDQKPEMSAYEVTDKIIESLEEDTHDAIMVNYANADLVGHSGNFEAAKKACEHLDKCLEKIIPLAQEKGYHIIITADHGNSDHMEYDDGSARPAHSLNAVPCFLITNKKIVPLEKRIIGEKNGVIMHGELCDIAPTILDMMEMEKPKEMTGKSFILSLF